MLGITTAIDEASCTDCGDGALEAPEVCDGALLGGEDCTTVGAFSGGTLKCNGTCNGYDTSMCFGAPTVPKPRLPMNGAYVGVMTVPGSLRPKFGWEGSTVQGGASVRYELQYSTDKNFGAAVTTTQMTTATNFQPAADLPNLSTLAPVGARYWWRVRACAGSACSAYSMARYVNVGRVPNDFNGDGFSDLAVVLPGKDAGGMNEVGEARVYFGANSASFASTAGWTMTGTSPGSVYRFGFVGDINADGFADVAVTPQGMLGQSLTSRVFFGTASPDQIFRLQRGRLLYSSTDRRRQWRRLRRYRKPGAQRRWHRGSSHLPRGSAAGRLAGTDHGA
jgi:hypothetical protein